MKKNKANIGVQFTGTREAAISYVLREAWHQATQTFVIHAIFLASALWMGRNVIALGALQKEAVMWLAGILAALIVCFEVVIPLLLYRAGPYLVHIVRLAAAVLLGFGAFQGLMTYYRANRLDLEDGFLWIGGMYIQKYNSYYHTGIQLPAGKEEYMMQAFVYLLLIVLLVQYFLAKVFRTNAFAFVFPAGVLIAELLVGDAPGLSGIFLFSAGCIFWVAGKRKQFRRQLAAVALWSAMFIAASFIFKIPAQKMVAKAPQYKQFQKTIESRISRINISDVWMDRETVTNQRPSYRDKKVLTITADGKINGNLYLKAFTGSDYVNGSWNADSDFADACKADGIDDIRMKEILWNEAAHVFQTMPGFVDPIGYTISYSSHLRDDALVPYFSDLTDNSKLLVEGDACIRKSVFSQMTAVDGINANDSLDVLQTLFTSYLGGNSDQYWNWYTQYANERYLQTNVAVTSAGDFARQCYDRALANDDVTRINEKRIRIADEVAAFLSRHYTYSWNLDTIGAGTDPVEYFLTTGKKGYCMHFASAGTLMLRELGVPARYAAGYVVKESAFQANDDGTYTATVIDRNAHAWTEIYLEQIGWVPVEVTAGYAKAQGALPTDAEETKKREEKEQEEAASSTENDLQPDGTETQVTETQTQSIQEESQSATEEAARPDDAVDGDGAVRDTSVTGGENSGNDSGSITGGNTWTAAASMLKRGIKVVVWVLAVTAGIAGAVMLRRRYVRSYQERLNSDFRKKKYKRAVRRMNRRIYKHLKHDAKHGDSCRSDREYEKLLRQMYPQISEASWKEYMQIVQKAVFSNENLTVEEAMACYEVYRVLFSLGLEQ